MPIQEIHILHHTHVDVGYTDLQPTVYQQHVEYIELALDYCRDTDNYPDDARFRWIHEFAWPVVRFLKERPERAEELFGRLQEGRMELCGLYLDPTELYDRRSLEISLRPALDLARKHGFPLATVMTTDIPGQAWCLPDIMAQCGLSYLSVSPNSMVSKPLEVPRPFYWIGPGGGRVLTWQTDWRKGWYGEGHNLGLLRGLQVAQELVMDYVRQLESEGYPWRALALHLAMDNCPPCPALSDLVREWNQQADLPRIRLSTNADFFARMADLHGQAFPEYRAAWPDWWSEGLGSAAYETALSRETHCQLARIEAMQQVLGDDTDLWPIWEDLLFFDEHTWGSSESATQPHAFCSRASWVLKAVHVYRAHDAARRVETKLARRLATGSVIAEGQGHPEFIAHRAPGARTVHLFNPLPDAFHGPVALPDWVEDGSELVGADGLRLPVQRSVATQLTGGHPWAVVSLPAGERAAFAVRTGTEKTQVCCVDTDVVFESPHFRLHLDACGRVLSLSDAETGKEWLDTGAPWGFAEVIHESIVGPHDRNAVWQRGQTEVPYGQRRTDAQFRREGSLVGARLVEVHQGPVFSAALVRSALPHAPVVETELRLWRSLRRLDVEIRVHKLPYEPYEGLYVAFPFALDQPRAFLHSGGATFEAEAEQLPGTCRDFYAVEHFVAVCDARRWVTLCPLDAPLVQLGEMTFGRWADHLFLRYGCIYSWVTNNFWYTNFPATQHGHLTFRYALTCGLGPLDLAQGEAFGRAARVGLVGAWAEDHQAPALT